MTGSSTIYSQYQAGGLAYIQSLVNNEVETNLQDFKRFVSDNPANWGSDDKKSLSESLGGFANSEGGIIVWGVNCSKNAAGADVVQSLHPIPNLTAVLAQMYTLSASLVSPAVIGTEHISIQDPAAGPDNGFIISHIPRGESVPHMSMVGQKFMFRAGSSFNPMPQWMVADRFGRRPQPNLSLSWLIQGHGTNQQGVFAMIHLALKNVGAGSAKYPGFVLHATQSFNPNEVNTMDLPKGMVVEKFGHEISGQCDHQAIVIPSRLLKFGVMNLRPLTADMEIDYDTFCDGFFGSGTLIITPAQLQSAALGAGAANF